MSSRPRQGKKAASRAVTLAPRHSRSANDTTKVGTPAARNLRMPFVTWLNCCSVQSMAARALSFRRSEASRAMQSGVHITIARNKTSVTPALTKCDGSFCGCLLLAPARKKSQNWKGCTLESSNTLRERSSHSARRCNIVWSNTASRGLTASSFVFTSM